MSKDVKGEIREGMEWSGVECGIGRWDTDGRVRV